MYTDTNSQCANGINRELSIQLFFLAQLVSDLLIKQARTIAMITTFFPTGLMNSLCGRHFFK